LKDYGELLNMKVLIYTRHSAPEISSSINF
jgi:hypothetical protein